MHNECIVIKMINVLYTEKYVIILLLSNNIICPFKCNKRELKMGALSTYMLCISTISDTWSLYTYSIFY